jgi:gliding motility-associated-like protein
VNSIPTTIIELGNDTSICPQNNVLEISGISNFGEGSWSVVSGSADFSNAQSVVTTVSNLQTGVNTLVFTTGISPCDASDTLQVSLLEDSDILCGEIFIPEGFSPNGDLSNDVFVIYGVDGKRIDIKVFNRWGNLVYESDSYQNNWDGVCNTGGVLFGENLPEGTYYYLVQIDGEAESRKGYLTLWR